MEDNSWIKSYRKIVDWEWFKKPEMVQIFTYLLHSANYEDRNWNGIVIKCGQLVTSYEGIKSKTDNSIQTIRTCINRLKSTGEITCETTNKYTIITICNYEEYQQNEKTSNKRSNKQDNKETTSQQQTTNKQLTTTKEYKEYKNIKNDKKDKKDKKEEKNNVDLKKTKEETILEIYNLYPSKCIVKNSSTGKCSKNKKMIEKLLETLSAEKIKRTIEWYVEDCKEHKRYMKNFGTFLGNLPEIPESEQQSSDETMNRQCVFICVGETRETSYFQYLTDLKRCGEEHVKFIRYVD